MTTIPVTDTDWALSKNHGLADPRANRMEEMYLAEVDVFSLHYRKWLLELADELVPADAG